MTRFVLSESESGVDAGVALGVLPARAAAYLLASGWSADMEGGGVTVGAALERCAESRWQYLLVKELYRWQVRGGVRDDLFEDSPAETNSERAAVLSAVRTDSAALAELFGPQWADMVSLAVAGDFSEDRMSDSLEAVDAGWWAGFAWPAAIDAASSVAVESGRRNQFLAAFNVACRLGHGVSRIAAADASRGLVVRDLIGVHGFDLSHYDRLTGPWRRHIGAVHRDDRHPTPYPSK
ncbi:hypothetical protein [Rhodococcus erythropolis]